MVLPVLPKNIKKIAYSLDLRVGFMTGEMKVTIHLMMLTLAAIKEEFTGTAVVKTSNDFSDNVISRKAFLVKTNNRLTYYRTPELQSDQNSSAAYLVPISN